MRYLPYNNQSTSQEEKQDIIQPLTPVPSSPPLVSTNGTPPPTIIISGEDDLMLLEECE
jgi:hypothetical protein